MTEIRKPHGRLAIAGDLLREEDNKSRIYKRNWQAFRTDDKRLGNIRE
jgi:hypothetical protein